MRPRLTYANAMASLALFLALVGGTAFAAGLPKSSVTSKTVRDGSLLSVDLADAEGVTGAEVQDGSLGAADFGAGSIDGATLPDGSVGGAKIADGSIAAADIASGAVGPGSLAPGAVTAANIRNNGLRGVDFAADALTGADVAEETLGTVPDTFTIGTGTNASGLISNQIYQAASPRQHGTDLHDGTFEIVAGCEPGDLVLAGGPVEAPNDTVIIESAHGNFNTWRARVRFKFGSPFDWRVGVICARTLR